MIGNKSNSFVCVCLLLGAFCWLIPSPVAFAEEESHSESHEEAEHGHAESEHANEAAHEEGHAAHEHSEDHHGEHEGGHHHAHPPEVPDALYWISQSMDPNAWYFPLFDGAGRVILNSLLVACFTFILFRKLASKLQMIPLRGQSLAELYIGTVDKFICDILGKEKGRIYVPFLGTLAIYIWFMNLAALVPGLMSPTVYLQQTFGLSICVFFYVQYTALKFNGIGGYLFHLMGEPQGAIMWAMVPLFFVLHVLGEFIKPVSLALRLYGNILGEHILLGVFAGLGVMIFQYLISFVGVENVWFGLPLHGLLLPIALIGATIQAVVFMTLSTIYIYLVLPHHDHGESHAEASAH